MKLHKTKKEHGVEIANREHAKGAGNGRQVGSAGLVLWPSFVAFLYRFRLGLFYPSEGVLVICQRSQASRAARFAFLLEFVRIFLESCVHLPHLVLLRSSQT